jgi:hypothetical protein
MLDALKAVIRTLHQGTDEDVDQLKARIRLFASPNSVVEGLLNDELFRWVSGADPFSPEV